MECSVPPLEDVPELLAKIELSTGLNAKNKSSISNNESSGFGGFKKGFFSNATKDKKKVTRLDSTKTSSSSNACSKSDSVVPPFISNSVKSSEPTLLTSKSTSKPTKPISSKVTSEARKSSEITPERTKSPVESQEQKSSKSSKLTAVTSQSSAATCENSKNVSGENKPQKPVPAPHVQKQVGTPSLVIPDVQEALRRHDPASAFEQAAQARLSASTTVSDILEDPTWLAILAEFQEDAEAAMVKYKDNAEVRSVMMQLCGTLGNNFLNMSSTSNRSEDDALVERLLSEPSVRAALQAPRVQRIMERAKAGRNDVVRRLMAEASDEDRQHIRTLIDFGLFSFSC